MPQPAVFIGFAPQSVYCVINDDVTHLIKEFGASMDFDSIILLLILNFELRHFSM